jgi:hypothetical protein
MFLSARVANRVLTILETVRRNPRWFRAAAKERSTSVEALLAAAITEGIGELLWPRRVGQHRRTRHD